LRPSPAPFDLAASVVAMAGLAVSYPVLDVLGRAPEFFVARAAPRNDAMLAALFLGVVIPGVAGLVVWVAARLHPRGGRIVHAVVFGALAAALVAQFVGRVAPDAVTVGVAVAGGAGLAWGLWARPRALLVLRWGAALPVLAIGMFGFATPVARLWSAVDLDLTTSGPVADVPVVVIVLDELPLASLLGPDGGIDRTRYPNLAALADDGVVYPNTTTVSAVSEHAVPALLSGRYPRVARLPTALDWPDTVLTRLAASHRVHSVEPITALCPAEVCGDSPVSRRGPRGWRLLVSDVSVIAGHVTLPAPLTRPLPRIDQTWGGFAEIGLDETALAPPAFGGILDAADAAIAAGRGADFAEVMQPRGDRPDLYVLHTLTPHRPWEYLPSGQRYLHVPTTDVEVVATGDPEEDEWTYLQARRRHLLMTGFADRKVGEVLDGLRTAGVYDEALVVLVADHGIGFVPGEDLRQPDTGNLSGIANVPLIVKYPDGPRGVVDDRDAEIVDVAVTIYDVLGVVTDGLDLDGASLLAPPRPRDRHWVVPILGFGPLHWTPAYRDADLAALTTWFEPGAGWDPVWRSGPHGDLVGRELADLTVRTTSEVLRVFDHADLLLAANAIDAIIPALVTGGLGYPEGTFDAPPDLALVVNGRVAAVGRGAPLGRTTAPFEVLVPPDVFGPTPNHIALYIVSERPGGRVLRATLAPDDERVDG
jgi:hypothetical protein